MKINTIKLSIGFLMVSVLFLGWNSSAHAALTVGATSIASDGDVTINGLVSGNTVSIANGVVTGAQIVNIANGASAANSTVNILSGTGTAGAGVLALGNNPRVTTVSLGNGDPSNALTISIGSAATATTTTVNIGSAVSASAVNLLAGTGRISFTGQLVSKGAVPTVGAGAGSIAATSTDTAGEVTSTTGAGKTAVVVNFAATYTAAPICVISPVDLEAGQLVSSSTTYVTVTATTLTINHLTAGTEAVWNWHCIKNE